MIDEVRVLRLLRGIADDLAVLRVEGAAMKNAGAISQRRCVWPSDSGTCWSMSTSPSGDEVVLARLTDLSDLERFGTEVAAFVTG